MSFTKWLNQKFILFQDGDREVTITQFAEWLGISQPQLSEYMKPEGKTTGKKPVVPKSARIIDLFYDKYGDEIYEVLPPPDDGLDALDPGFVSRFRAARFRTVKELKNKDVSATSPEGKEIMNKIFSEFGIDLKETV